MNTQVLVVGFERDHIWFWRQKPSNLRSDLNQDNLKLELTVSRVFHKAINKTRTMDIFERNEFEFLGNILFNLICLQNSKADHVNEIIYRELAMILMDKSVRGIVALCFSQDAEVAKLAQLPWEFLQAKVDNKESTKPFFLSAHRKAKFDLIRLIPNNNAELSEVYLAEPMKQLTIVFVICFPNKKTHDIEHLIDFVRSLNENTVHSNRIKVFEMFIQKISDFYLQMSALSEELDGTAYILHFISHAEMKNNQAKFAIQHELTLEDRSNNKRIEDCRTWCELSVFGDFFDSDQDYPQPICVVMQACESGQLNDYGEGFGPVILAKNIPYVLAMQNDISPETAREFFQKFYTNINDGVDFFQSVSKGRTFLGCEYDIKTPENAASHYTKNIFGTPVIFSSTTTSVQFLASKQEEETEEKPVIETADKISSSGILANKRGKDKEDSDLAEFPDRAKIGSSLSHGAAINHAKAKE